MALPITPIDTSAGAVPAAKASIASAPVMEDPVAAATDNHVLVVRIEGAAHAINFSHPGELAHIIRLFMADRPIVDDPASPGHASLYEIHRGRHLPSTD